MFLYKAYSESIFDNDENEILFVHSQDEFQVKFIKIG